MNMKFIDTHAHLNSEEFRDNIEAFIENAKQMGVDKIIVPGTDKEDSIEAIAMAKKHESLYALAGLHPSYVKDETSANWIDEINPNDIIAVGEAGIDLYWEDNPSIELQEIAFKKQLDYAKKHNKLMIVHMRNAEKEVYNILSSDEYKDVRFLLHCSTTSYEWNKKFVDLGGYVSFSGVVTFKKAFDVHESAIKLPLDKIVVETDAPYLAPQPKRGKTNEPAYVSYTAKHIASLREENDEEVIKALYNNSLRLFGLNKV